MTLDERSLDLRRMAWAALCATNGGHVGGSMSAIEIMRVLYDDVARHRPREPTWPQRDRVILSKGHGCIAQYVMLASHGYIDSTELATVGQANARLGGHPEWGMVPGVEYSTGSLGHGLPAGVGMALELRRQQSPSRVFVIVGDGELDEGSVWEAIMAATHYRLSNLCLLVDANGLQSAGPTAAILDHRDLVGRLRAFGCATSQVDGHDPSAIATALQAEAGEQMQAVVCRTVKGRGVPPAEGQPTWHYRMGLDAADVATTWTALGCDPLMPPHLSDWSAISVAPSTDTMGGTP